MCLNNIIMSIKNVFITSGITILFGVYSIYNILDYLNNINNIYNHKLLDLQKKLVETDKNYNNLYFDFIKIKNEVDFLSGKIVIIEKKLTERPLYCFSPNFDYYESSEDDKKTNETIRITSDKTNLNGDNNYVPTNTLTIVSSQNNDVKLNNDVITEKMEYDCVEIVNITDINVLHVSDCSNKTNSSVNSEKEPLYKSRSASISDVNWSGLMKTFLLG